MKSTRYGVRMTPQEWADRAGAPAKPHNCNPQQSAELSWDSRRLRCVGYDACLSYAEAVGWDGFSCDKCKKRREYRQGSDEDRDDWHGLAALLAVIVSDGPMVTAFGLMARTRRERIKERAR